jgi:toxin ParE1/3/4
LTKVRYTETSLGEIDDIFSFIAQKNPKAAAAVVDRTQTTIKRLGEFPHLGQMQTKIA